MNKKKIIVIVLLIIIGLAVALQLKRNRDRNTSSSENLVVAEVAVSVSKGTRKNVSYQLELVGSAYPIREVDIAAQTQGRIDSLNFAPGQKIHVGSVLGLIDDKTKQLACQSARINAEKATKDYERTANLFKGGGCSEQDFENARTARENASINLQVAEKQYLDSRIVAPFNGIISDKKVELGAYVVPGTPVASIVDISRLKAKLKVSETNIYTLRVGDRAKIKSDLQPDADFAGVVTFIGPRGDDSHNYPVEIEFPNNGKSLLKGGTFVTVSIQVEAHRDGLFIPREALQGSIKDARVYVAEGGVARLKNIVIGERIGNMLEVISGLSDSEKVIVSGQVNLTSGKAIKIISND
jgi:RND family efflux transporter MFP subunit